MPRNIMGAVTNKAIKDSGGDLPVYYNKNVDYTARINDAVKRGDYQAAATYEKQRNAKIDGEGMSQYQKTYNYGSKYDVHHMSDSQLAAIGTGGLSPTDPALEDMRAGYGYSGGSSGLEYIPLRQETKTPAFSYGSAPTYVNKYQDLIDELSGRILNQDPFSYDAESDPLYQQYRTGYTRGGERAMQDTMGQLSARTGGMASSYAESAAQQTYNGYMSALADKIPELQQLAYSMYQDEGEKQRLNLQMIAALEQNDYAKYQDLLSQYNTDRSFAYGQYRDQLADQRYDDETAYNRGVYSDETAYNRGIYSDETDYDRKLQRAKLLAGTGDFSGYLELGYTDDDIRRLQAAFYLENPTYAALDQSSSGLGGVGLEGLNPDFYLGPFSVGPQIWGTPGSGSYSSGGSSYTGSGAAGSGSSYTGSGTAGGANKTGESGSGSLPTIYGTDALGLGPISQGGVRQLVDIGRVELYTDAGGKLRCRWASPNGAKGYAQLANSLRGG